MSNFPQHQGTLFLGVMTLVPTAKYTTETSTPSRRRWSICFFFFRVFLDSLRPTYPKNVTSEYFPNVGVTAVVTIVASHCEGGIPEPLRLARSNFLRYSNIKDDEDTGQKSQGISNFVEPTRTIKKNRARNASPRNSTGGTSFRILRKSEFRQINMV